MGLSQRSVMVTHPGGQHSAQTALALQEADLLSQYVTGLFIGRRKRAFLNRSQVKSFPWEDLLCVLMSRNVWLEKLSGRFHIYQWRIRQFDRRCAQLILREKPKAVICYDTCAIETFKAAKKVGALCILDQTIGHLTSAVQVFKQWNIASNISQSLIDDACLEIKLADKILAGSDYVKQTLLSAAASPEKIVLLPYGVDIQKFKPGLPRNDGEFRMLFAGRLSHRKGIQFVFDAFRACQDLPQLRLWLAGPVWGKAEWMEPYRSQGRLKYWEQLPHHQMSEVFSSADIFLFPSLHEGSALTTYEAMASGLPLITTFNSGTTVRDNEQGFVVPLGDIDTIVQKIRLLYSDFELRKRMALSARKRVEEFTWINYRNRLADSVRQWIA